MRTKKEHFLRKWLCFAFVLVLVGGLAVAASPVLPATVAGYAVCVGFLLCIVGCVGAIRMVLRSIPTLREIARRQKHKILVPLTLLAMGAVMFSITMFARKAFNSLIN